VLANPIPGNTIAVVNTIDRLMMQGAKVVYGREGIHVSGHGCQEDQKLMISRALSSSCRFTESIGLVKHAGAQSMGMPPENMLIIQNGDVVEVSESGIRVAGKVQAGVELVDTSGSGMVSGKVLKERQRLAEEGIITVAAVD